MKLPDTLETIQIDALIPYARNSRTHSDAQVAQIAASIKEFGFTNPVLIDAGGGIIAGHGRVLAARKLGLSEVPCIRLEHLTDAQKRAYVIADNRLASSGSVRPSVPTGASSSLISSRSKPVSSRSKPSSCRSANSTFSISMQ